MFSLFITRAHTHIHTREHTNNKQRKHYIYFKAPDITCVYKRIDGNIKNERKGSEKKTQEKKRNSRDKCTFCRMLCAMISIRAPPSTAPNAGQTFLISKQFSISCHDSLQYYWCTSVTHLLYTANVSRHRRRDATASPTFAIP